MSTAEMDKTLKKIIKNHIFFNKLEITNLFDRLIPIKFLRGTFYSNNTHMYKKEHLREAFYIGYIIN